MGAVDLVIQVESPGAVSRGLQRIGRAGHSVGAPSRGSIFPKHRGDLLEAAIVTRRMVDGLIESTHFLRNPLDVLAQQIVAHVAAVEECSVEEVGRLVRGCANFAQISDELSTNVLDLLSGRYPSEEFSELRPRLVWDRVNNRVRARDGSKRLAVTSGGTIPDRGLFGVFLPDGTRVGELDEEMVYESRPGETFILGASTWRIEDITFERVTVTPAPGQPGKMPFWHGDRSGRPLELGRALGAFVREIRELDEPAAVERLHVALLARRVRRATTSCSTSANRSRPRAPCPTIARSSSNASATRSATGGCASSARSVRRSTRRGRWRSSVAWPTSSTSRSSPCGATTASSSGCPSRPTSCRSMRCSSIPTTSTNSSCRTLPQTALFAARFRECAGRALLLPRRRPDRRTPLWQQRQRAADLLAVASKYPTFPILLETSRECLQDVFDVPALREVLGQLRSRAIRVVNVDTGSASPMASSLLFNWIAAYMYEGDAPLAERRAAALALDRDLLRDLLGAEELRELLDADVLADVELELQCLAEGRRARSADELHDVLRTVGDLVAAEVDLRCEGPDATPSGAGLGRELLAEKRAIELAVGGDALRRRRGCGALPRRAGVFAPARAADGVHRAGRRGRSRSWSAGTPAPTARSSCADVARRFGSTTERVGGAIAALEADEPHRARRVPPGRRVARVVRRRRAAPVAAAIAGRCAARSSRSSRGRSPASCRPGTTSRPSAVGSSARRSARRAVGRRARRLDDRDRRVAARVRGYAAADARRAVHRRRGGVGRRRRPRRTDGRIRLCFADQLPCSRRRGSTAIRPTDVARFVRGHAGRRRAPASGGSCARPVPGSADAELLVALWDLVWAGEVTNDSLAPLRAVLGGASPKAARTAAGAVARAATARGG